jgi:3-hydroxy-3-methylglutaryl CoA synthase
MGAMTVPRVGIEKLHVYPGSLALPMQALCAARGHPVEDVRDVLMVDERSVNPEWEDPVTMAVNAAKPLIASEDRDRIGLLIVATESGVDQEKPISTWVQRYLGLSSRVRNVEMKHACYGATAALQLAATWIASGAAGGRAALVINTDQSRMHLGKPWEYVLGAAAAAVVLSSRPDVLEIELGASGVYTDEVSDLTRPTATVETGNSETSLLSYLDALDAAFDDYELNCPPAASENYFARNIYHLPFGGMGYRAHKAVLRRQGITAKAAIWASFTRKTLPSLVFARRMGGTYGASTFIALLGLLTSDRELHAGDRLGIFSYGSGCCAELWSGLVGAQARPAAEAAGLIKLLDARRALTVAEYEAIERARTSLVDNGDFETNLASLGDWYDRYYAGKGLLVFRGMKEYYRQYAWS